MKTITMIIAEIAGISYKEAVRVHRLIDAEKLFDWSAPATPAQFEAVIRETANRISIQDSLKKEGK